MPRSWSWPFAVVILFSFLFGAIWGWKLIRDRKEVEGRLEAEAKIKILAPPGVFTRDQLIEFQRRDRIEVELTTEPYPGALLRRALKSAPGQFDLVFVFHHQVPSLRAERKLVSLYDSRNKFPTTIAPDFRKLTDDRNLMDTAPLLWGLLGVVTKKGLDVSKASFAFWPTPLIALELPDSQVPSFVAKVRNRLPALDAIAQQGLFSGAAKLTAPAVITHGQVEFQPLKDQIHDQALEFQPIEDRFPLWIITAVAMSDGDLERSRKFLKFLLDPGENARLVLGTRGGASTLRPQGESVLAKSLQSTYLRTVPIDRVAIDHDERLRQSDDLIEQLAMGAQPKPEPTKPPPLKPIGFPTVSDSALPPVAKPPVAKVATPPRPKPKPKPTPAPSTEPTSSNADAAASEVSAPQAPAEAPTLTPPPVPPSASPTSAPTEPKAQSEETAPAD